MDDKLVRAQSSGHSVSVLGNAAIARILYEKRDISRVWENLYARVCADPSDTAAFLDLSSILYAWRRHEDAASTQMAALASNKNYRIDNGDGAGLKVLVFCTVGDPTTQTPIEFLLESSNTSVLLHYVDAETPGLEDVPEHDVAFIGIAGSTKNLPALEKLGQLVSGWRGPTMNISPQRILNLSRFGLANLLRDEPTIVVPEVTRIVRHDLAAVAFQELNLAAIDMITRLPFIVRPVDAVLGNGIERVSTGLELSAYLCSRSDQEFEIAPFIDYCDGDGKYRRRRIVFINGVAFADHLVISDQWMAPYQPAIPSPSMEASAQEAAWIANFEIDFAVRHARSFDALHRCFGLDYFAIDCAELADGRLLLFKAGVGLTLHTVRPCGLSPLPHQKIAGEKLRTAFEDGLTDRVRRATSSNNVTCAHTGKHAVYQRTAHDCLICALAMFTGRTYEEIIAMAGDCDPLFPISGPMSHSIMRGVADRCGLQLLSGIFMLWERPAIIGMVSPTIFDSGHAVFWDGEKLIDPGFCGRVDRAYVDRCGVEFIQCAADLAPLIDYENQLSQSTEKVHLDTTLT